MGFFLSFLVFRIIFNTVVSLWIFKIFYLTVKDVGVSFVLCGYAYIVLEFTPRLDHHRLILDKFVRVHVHPEPNLVRRHRQARQEKPLRWLE